MRKSLVVLGIGAALVASLMFSVPAMADVSEGYHNADIGKMVAFDKAYAHADVATVAPASQKIANTDVHLESNPKIAMASCPDGDGHKLCMAGCNTKSESRNSERLNL